MKLWSDSFGNGEAIPARCAFGKHNPQTHVELSDNENPHLAWSDLPAGTKSLVLVCHDSDVPSRPDHVNKEGVTVLAPTPAEIGEGELSDGITPRGKPGPAAARGTRQGVNNYTQWFAGDADMAGDYFGYDGPCPPWNDEIVHHYHFTLYATDLEKCPVAGSFTGPEVLSAIQGHVLGQAALVGTYAVNPNPRR
jgi:hypothetical protein